MGMRRGFVASCILLVVILLEVGGPVAGDEDPRYPVAVITWQGKAELGGKVVFSGANSTDDVGVVNWTWKISSNLRGHLATLYGETVEFRFRQGDEHYFVELRVRDSEGFSTTSNQHFYIEGDEEDTITWSVIVAFICFIVIVNFAMLVWITRRRGDDTTEKGPHQEER